MALQPALTWTTLFAHYSADAWTPLLQLARTTYAQQGQLLTAAQYLALAPTAAAVPFVGSTAAAQLLADTLPAAAGEPAATYADYAARGTAQPVLRALGDALTAQGTTPAELEAGRAAQGAADYLAQTLTPTAWASLVGAAQRQAQYRLDEAARAAELRTGAPVLAPAYERVLATLPGTSLEALVALPANELARALWVPAPAADDLFINELVTALQTAAQRVLAENYPTAEQADRLLALLDLALQGVAQALLAQAAATEPHVTELAQAAPGEVAAYLAALPANHPAVYALAAALQAAGQRVLLAGAPVAPAAPQPLGFSARLLDHAEAPLVDFNLVLTQVLAGGERALGSLPTDAQGRISLRVLRDAYLADDDTVAERPVSVRAAVYRPAQDPAGEPLLTLLLAPTTEGEELLFATSLDTAALDAAPMSAPLAGLAGELPAALGEVLAARDITTLADVRAAGGLQSLLAELDASDEPAVAAARRLDGLAQFEVVSADTAFHEQVVAAGFSSPGQLLDTASPDEFVQRLAPADAPTELRAQAQEFYQQVAATQSLSQALGLLMAGAQASGTGPAAAPAASLRSARYRLAPSAGFAADGAAEDAATLTAEAATDAGAEPDDSTSIKRLLPGRVVTPAFNPASINKEFYYDSTQQCDCPACRSAVSPTAYLAALLKYATTNLRAAGTAPTVGELQAKFHQPFSSLRVSCQAAEEPVCQYRLAIEVIQDYARAKGALTLDQARPYVEAMLEALLQALGTSLAELRTAPAAQLPALASRLAVPEATLTQLRDTFSVARLAASTSLTDLEADLERCFGLASTARDPLSSGLVLAAPAGDTKLVRWNLQGVEWGVNTSPDGLLYVEVTSDFSATPQFSVVVYKASLTPGEEAKIEDNVVARGEFSPLDAPGLPQFTYHHAALLYPQHGSGLSGSVLLQIGFGTLARSTAFTLAVVPAITAGQQQALLDGWLRQDAAALDLLAPAGPTTWNGSSFLIDPDLLGPDDFRPLVPTAADRGNVAYRLWRRRYDFLQNDLPKQLLPASKPLSSKNLGLLIDSLNQRTISYTTLDNIAWNVLPWSVATGFSGAPGTRVLTDLLAALASAPTPASAGLLAGLGLPAEGVQRLYDLWQLSLASNLTDSDLQEAVDLVRQSAKHAFADSWYSEEQDNGPSGLSLTYFQPALHEPQAGAWEPLRAPAFGLTASQLPRLDPDEVTPLDLPDAGFGDAAATLWGTRQAELLRKRQALVASGASAPTPAARAAAMLAYAYRPNPATPTTGLPGTPPVATLAELSAAYQNDADPKSGVAKKYVAETLGLRPNEAQRLLALLALATSQPTDGLWQELAALLTLGWKRAVAYRQGYVPEGSTTAGLSWLAQEAAAFPGTALDYLIGTRKHHLVKWRATAAARATWGQVLSLLAQRPLIDPDQLVPGDFRQAGERSRVVYAPPVSDADQPYLNSAYDLFAQRTAQVQQWLADVQAAWPATTAGQWAYVADQLHTTPADLQELHRQLGAGVDVRAALRRLGLPAAGLTLLATQIEDPAATDRLTELHHLLVQLRRSRAYAAWALEERAQGLNASPQYFRRPAPETASLATLPWRSSATARRQWQRTLSARFAQADALTAARQQAVRSAEDQHLPLLREALITYQIDAAPAGFDSKADWLNSLFLLDFKTTCCQHTTRVAQGMEVLQKLFGNLRGGLPSNDLTLASSLTTFEGDWQWLGSYERWRSLLFLYLYPQNVLLPALKPGQSSQYRQTVSAIRQAPSVSPATARAYMDAYQVYLNDLGTLKTAAAVQTTLFAASNDGFSQPGDRVPVSLQIATSAANRAYANLCYLTGAAATEPAAVSWARLPGEALVERVIGAAVYAPAGQGRYAYVFACLREDKKDTLALGFTTYLAFQRFNLQTQRWDDDYTRLELGGTGALRPADMQVSISADETLPPFIVGLRNPRTPLMSEYPFSTLKLAFTGPVAYIAGGLGNIDLFRAALDAQGTGIGSVWTKTFFLVSEVRLLSCLRQDTGSLIYFLGVRLGSDKSLKLQTLTTTLTPGSILEGRGDYLVGGDLRLATRGAISNNSTPAFSYNPYGDQPVASFQALVGLIEDIYLGRVAGLPTAYATENLRTNNSSGNYLPLPGTLGTDVVTPVGTRIVSTELPYQGNVSYFRSQVLDIYYNVYNTPDQPAVTQKLTLSFEQLGWVHAGPNPAVDLQPQTLAIRPVSDAYSTCYEYVGPPVRTSFLNGQTAAPTALVTSYRAFAYPVVVPGKATIVDGATTRTIYQQLPALPPLFSSLNATDQASRRTALAAVNGTSPLDQSSFVSNLVSEAYYALPMLLAQELMRSRNYELALHYYRLVYDYTQLAAPTTAPDPKRLVYPGLVGTGAASYSQEKVLAWLQDPSNPYTLAALRPDSHLQYVVMSVARCLLAYADTEFTTDTAESVSRARTLYELAARLLKQDITQYAVQDSASLLDPLDALLPAAWLAEWRALKGVLARVNQRNVLDEVLHQATLTTSAGQRGPGLAWLFAEAQQGNLAWDEAFNLAWQLVNGQLATLPYGYLTLGAAQDMAQPAGTLGLPVPAVGTVRPYVPFLAANFCVPTNPVPFALALQAELNLFKIRSCRNIAGIQRELDPYAAATDNTTGLPTVNASGQLTRSARLVVPATPYRYAYIIERARQIVALAQQTESTLLSALEKRDAEAYNLLKARQDIAVSQATVQLQTLRVTEAEDGVDLAGLQLERSEISEQQYEDWLSAGLNGYEQDTLEALKVAATAAAVGGILSAATAIAGAIINPLDTASSIGSIAKAAQDVATAQAQYAQAQATFERRANDWNFQKNLAAKDIQINKQQIQIADDQVRITGQEKQISQLQLDHAQSVLDFLTTKFTNAELYDWMSRILENAYGYFLQQATATARLAEQQLAFERQQVPAGIVQADYYSDPVDDASSMGLTPGGSTSTSRKGLTGSVRLLQDITRLDEYAFETNRRKLQLSKTISLAQSFPTEFVRFRETGLVSFACQPEWFDQDFPGQYLRVVRRVRTSVIALVPPVEGIKARLSTAGTSHVTVDGTPFQTLALPRAQEAVALTSPLNATGLYELDTQNELLLPFEGLGVDVPWQFSMQPASNPGLDYSAVADVLITLDYSALESADYARQVVQQLGTERRQVVALSLRDRFADQWYDLHHAEELEAADQYRARLTLTAADLPRHLRNATVSQLSLYVDAPLDDATDPTAPSPAFTDRSHLELRLTRGAGVGGAAFTNQYGLISTRTGTGAGPLYTGNAAALVPLLGAAPAGDWVLSIAPGRLRERLAAGLVNDIYLILEVEGDAPAYVL